MLLIINLSISRHASKSVLDEILLIPFHGICSTHEQFFQMLLSSGNSQNSCAVQFGLFSHCAEVFRMNRTVTPKRQLPQGHLHLRVSIHSASTSSNPHWGGVKSASGDLGRGRKGKEMSHKCYHTLKPLGLKNSWAGS